MSYDDWKDTDPADNKLGRASGKPERYRCTQCPWSGTGIIAASNHFWGTEHTVKPASDPRFHRKPTERRSA